MATAAPTATNATGYLDLDGLDLIPPMTTAKSTTADANRLITWVKKRAYSSSPIYAEDFSRCRKAELYDQSNQWLQRAKGTSDATYASQWKRLEAIDRDGNVIPLPVLNEGVLLRENESARLGRPEYKPRVKPTGKSPGIKEKEGAKGGERAVTSRLTDMWADEEDKLYLHMPLYGGAWLKSYWDQTWLDTVRVPIPSLICPFNPKAQTQQQQQQAAQAQQPPGQPVPGQPPMPDQPPLPITSAASPTAAVAPGMGQSPVSPASAPPPPVEQVPPAVPGGGMSVPSVAGMATAPSPGGQPLQPQQPLPPSPMPIPPQCNFVCPVEDRPNSNTCPYHQDQQLLPYQPSLEEAATTNLGKDVQKGDWFMQVRYPYQVFPVDVGINIDPTCVPEWVEQYTMPISWAEERWPDKVRDFATGLLRVHPQNPASLLAANPTLGSPDILRHIQTTAVYRTHVVVYEYHRRPWMEWQPGPTANGRQLPGRYVKNQGRTVFCIIGGGGNGVVCMDAPFQIESLNKPGTFVDRVLLQFIPWEKFDGGRRTTVGQSLWDRLFDPQDGINERAAQVRAVNQRGADPVYIEKRGSNLEGVAGDSAVPFRRIQADLDPNDKQPPLQLLNNEVVNPGVYQEMEHDLAYMKRNQVEVERGQVPPGVAAATAIAYLKTEAGETRRPRILRIRRSLVRAWTHGLQLMSALYIEPRPYSYEDENGEQRQAFITGDVIAQANPKVDIYPTPDYDITDARRENIRDMVQLGIINPKASPQLARKIVEMMDESLDFFLDDDHQEQQAQREWQYFMEEGRIPVTDPSLDEDQTHYQCHGRDCFSEWFRQAENDARWDDVLKVIGGDWDLILDAVVQTLVAPTPIAPVGVDPTTLPKPGPKPPADDLLKAAWLSKIQQADSLHQQDPQPGYTPLLPNQALTLVVIPWRAHMEAHRVKVMVKQLRDQMKAAGVAMPAAGAGGAVPQAPGQGSQPGPEAPGQGGQGAPQGAPPPGNGQPQPQPQQAGATQ